MRFVLLRGYGAGEGNRTPTTGLEGQRSAIELLPHYVLTILRQTRDPAHDPPVQNACTTSGHDDTHRTVTKFTTFLDEFVGPGVDLSLIEMAPRNPDDLRPVAFGLVDVNIGIDMNASP